MNAPLSTSHNERHWGLDVLRFIAFLRVFFSHLPLTGSLGSILSPYQRGGGMGVILFFILSGLLITQGLAKNYQKLGTIDYFSFYRKRIFRLIPAYWLLLIICYSLYHLGIGGESGKEQIGYTPNLLASLLWVDNYRSLITGLLPAFGPITPLWSLCIEVHFYLLFPILLGSFKIDHWKKILSLALVAGISFRLLYASFASDNYGIYFIDLPTYIDAFAIGGWIGLSNVSALSKRAKIPLFFLGLVGMMVLWGPGLYWEGSAWFTALTQTLSTYALAGLVLAVHGITQNTNPSRIVRLIAYFGVLSYSLYLFHVLFLRVGWNLALKLHMLPQSSLSNVTFTSIMLGLLLVFAHLSWKYFELPLIRKYGPRPPQ